MDLNSAIQTLTLSIPGLLFAMVFHEFAHGYVANHFGDPTPRMDGRLTLNPVVHLEMLGSVILPIICLLSGGFIFGWAKPIMTSPRYLKNIRRDMFWISFAGPFANIILMVISAILLAIFYTKVPPTFFLFDPLIRMLQQSMYINVFMAVFNLIPFPPLDGSKMVMTFLQYEDQIKYAQLGRYSLIFFVIMSVTKIFDYISYPALVLSNLILGTFLKILQ